MRELAYAWIFSAPRRSLCPAYRGKIPLVIKNTNNPEHPEGLWITLKHSGPTVPVIGNIAADDEFGSINLF